MYKVMDKLKETTQTNFKWEEAAVKKADQLIKHGSSKSRKSFGDGIFETNFNSMI